MALDGGLWWLKVAACAILASWEHEKIYDMILVMKAEDTAEAIRLRGRFTAFAAFYRVLPRFAARRPGDGSGSKLKRV